MFHKLKKANAVSKVGDYIDVHKDQKDDLVKRGIIEEDGVIDNPDAPKPVEPGKAEVSTTSDLTVDPKADKAK